MSQELETGNDLALDERWRGELQNAVGEEELIEMREGGLTELSLDISSHLRWYSGGRL